MSLSREEIVAALVGVIERSGHERLEILQDSRGRCRTGWCVDTHGNGWHVTEYTPGVAVVIPVRMRAGVLVELVTLLDQTGYRRLEIYRTGRAEHPYGGYCVPGRFSGEGHAWNTHDYVRTARVGGR